MTVKNPKELFVMLLSDARQSTERSTNFYQEISQAAEDPDIKEALESRAWISEKDLSSIDRCFELIGEKPVKLSGRLQEVFVEDLRLLKKQPVSPRKEAVVLCMNGSPRDHGESRTHHVQQIVTALAPRVNLSSRASLRSDSCLF